MKRLVCILLLVCLSLPCLTSCDSTVDSDEKLSIITTIFPQYDFARQIVKGGEEAVSLTMMLPPGSESHDYEATLSDISAIATADLIICVGGETDEWIETAIDLSSSEATVLRLTDMVPLYHEDSEGIFEDAHEHSHGHEEHGDSCDTDHAEFDEHVWTAPENAAVMTSVIADTLCTLLPEMKDLFTANALAYSRELTKLQEDMEKAVANGELDTLIFADRFPFRYLTESLGIHHLAAFSGCSSDTEPSLSTIYQLTEKAKSIYAPVILTAEFSNGYAASVIADEVGSRVRTLHSCHNVSKEDFDNGVTYADIMRRNLSVLTEALTPID